MGEPMLAAGVCAFLYAGQFIIRFSLQTVRNPVTLNVAQQGMRILFNNLSFLIQNSGYYGFTVLLFFRSNLNKRIYSLFYDRKLSTGI
jgi:hypothetical protein